MFARVSIAQGLPGKQDEITRIHRESVVPACRTQKGFKGFLQLSDAKMGKGITISLWETEADMTAAETSGFYQQQVVRFKDLLAGPVVRETYEVSVHE